MNNPAGGLRQIGTKTMFADHTFARFFDTTVVVAFVALSVMLAGATAIVGA